MLKIKIINSNDLQNLRKEFKQHDGFCASSCCSQEEPKLKKRVAVRCLSLSVDAGEVLGLLGKSFSINMLNSTDFNNILNV